jgi:molybdate transport system substrate-binding protein
MRSTRRLCVALLLCLPLGCARNKSVPRPTPKQEVTVFAAASLREPFTTLAQKLEAERPGAHVVLSFAGSQALRSQIEQDAPADVFASADERHMQALVTAGRVLEPRVFAKNDLVLVVALAKEGALRELKNLPDAERIVLGGAEVPVGAYTLKALDAASRDYGRDFRARVEAHVVSREPDVRQVLAKVALGEADAGIVYRTDALSQKGKVVVVSIPVAYNVIAEYPVAVTHSSPHAELGHAFVELLLSPEGQSVLAQQGFLPPSAGALAR